MTHDVIVIGAGPAGMTAALTASEFGLKVALIDEQPRPGGQIYRNVGIADASIRHHLGPDYSAGAQIVDRFVRSSVDVYSGALVWDIDQKRTVSILAAGRVDQLTAHHLIIATGAIERPSAIPGWTLPGVMTAGAAQIALKSGPSVPEGRIVLGGTGPLLLLVACQLIEAGANVVALVETAPRSNLTPALAALPGALRAPAPLLKGIRMLATLRAEKLARYASARELSIEGVDRARGLSFVHHRTPVSVEADVVLLHHGVVPNTQLTRLLKLDHLWNDSQLAWIPKRDASGLTSRDGIWIAGDGGGIDGARAAEASGALVALNIVHRSGLVDNPTFEARASNWRRTLAKERAVRPFLEALYRPPQWIGSPADETLVCRCEEVTARRVREMARLGCAGPNQTKFFSRCGMGPCQGRMCAITVTQLLAEERGVSPGDIGAYHVRAPIKPITLHALATLREKHSPTE
ncbi:NAD(P)/FAD-dependent oxidoreductase (plasmid) [Paraburkholderia sp. PREW-6R]|uniref:NAD(P)/FAD-dependent oxidoreductase n=1 Tax=Paraburkholderia sp. PREW-6R TaxID=3141544 RepID=UPI0031F4A66F